MHPYLTVGKVPVDPLELRVPARTVLETNERCLPTGSASVAGTDFDFRNGRAIGTLRLDHCFADLDRDAAGRATVELRDPSGGARRTLWVDAAFPYLMVFSGDTLGDAARRSVAVEPMTCPPNAFRSGDDLVRLEPGGSSDRKLGHHHDLNTGKAQSDDAAGTPAACPRRRVGAAHRRAGGGSPNSRQPPAGWRDGGPTGRLVGGAGRGLDPSVGHTLEPPRQRTEWETPRAGAGAP